MSIHLYRNRTDQYVLVDDDFRLTTRVLLLKARRKRSFGACITSSPLCAWISYPRQVFGFASEDGREDIHIGGFDQGPFSWDDYAGDFYEIFTLDIELMSKLRSILTELDFEIALEWLLKLQDLIQHINWRANTSFTTPSSEECLTDNDAVYVYLQKIFEIMEKYLPCIHSHIFSYKHPKPTSLHKLIRASARELPLNQHPTYLV